MFLPNWVGNVTRTYQGDHLDWVNKIPEEEHKECVPLVQQQGAAKQVETSTTMLSQSWARDIFFRITDNVTMRIAPTTKNLQLKQVFWN